MHLIFEKETDKLIQTIELDCQLFGLDNVSVGDYNFKVGNMALNYLIMGGNYSRDCHREKPYKIARIEFQSSRQS